MSKGPGEGSLFFDSLKEAGTSMLVLVLAHYLLA
jgi:hypothetical protein